MSDTTTSTSFRLVPVYDANYTERDSALGEYSDAYKCAYGMRPHGAPQGLSTEALWVEIEALYKYANEQYADEQAAEAEWVAEQVEAEAWEARLSVASDEDDEWDFIEAQVSRKGIARTVASQRARFNG